MVKEVRREILTRCTRRWAGRKCSRPGGGHTRRGERRKEKKAQLTRDFKQQDHSRTATSEQDRDHDISENRPKQQGRGLQTRGRGHGSQFSSGQGRGGRGTLDVSLRLSFKLHTMGVPSLDFDRAARPRVALGLPPAAMPTPSSCNPGRGALCFCISAETSDPCTAV